MPRTVRTMKLPGLPTCGFDDYEPVLEVSSGKRYRICCPHCETTTNWGKKTDAVIEWFNLSAKLRAIVADARKAR